MGKLNSSGCPMIPAGADGSGNIGPPTTDVHIPSNLEVDPYSWFTNVYTFSPVWQPPMITTMTDIAATGDEPTMAVTEKDRIRVESCYDEETKSVRLNVEFKDVEPIVMGATTELPWISLGYRTSDVCSMTPPDGGSSDIIM